MEPKWVVMPGLMGLGLLVAVAQHCFYSYINGLQPDDFFLEQSSVIRVGAALAYLVKTCLVTSVSVAFVHSSWAFFRRQAYSVGGIDAIFGVLMNPLNFFNADFLLRAKTLYLLALITWLLPLTAIFAPSSLTVITTQSSSVAPVAAPVVGPLDGNVGFYEYVGLLPVDFGGPAPVIQKLATRIFTTGEVVTWNSPCGANCTYEISFNGPAYKCTDSNETNADDISPQSKILYLAEQSFIGLIDNRTMANSNVSDGIWIRRNPGNGIYIQATHCLLYNATYTTNVTYFKSIQRLNTTVDLHQPILSSVFTDLVYMDQEFMPQVDMNGTRSLVNYFAIEQAVESVLLGYLRQSPGAGSNKYEGTAMIQLWDFVYLFESINSTSTSIFPADFSTKVEELLQNTTLSLIQYVDNPIIPESSVDFGPDVPPAVNRVTNAMITSFITHYSYSAKILWEIYGISVAISVLCIVFGGFMLFRNGVDSNVSFSQVLVTTRNPSLDRLCSGAGLGGETVPEDLSKVRLKYGELIFDDGEGVSTHACFGLVDEIRKA